MNLLLPNKLGNRSAGRESAPPIMGLFQICVKEVNQMLSDELLMVLEQLTL